MLLIRRAFLPLLVALGLTAHAQAAEIAPGVSITPRAFDVPINEQPFFGFMDKTEDQKAADAKFVEAITVKNGLSREEGGKRVARAGWQFIFERGDWETAAKRFNQAWLLDPKRSEIAHGFAIIVFERFRDHEYAGTLFRVAKSLKEPLPSLPADHGRMLLRAGKPAEAIPLLEEAIAKTPDWALPHANLASAYSETGQPAKACAVLDKTPTKASDELKQHMARVRTQAKCP